MVTASDVECLDLALQARSAAYARLRAMGGCGPPTLRRLQRGSVERTRQRYLEQWKQQPAITWSQVSGAGCGENLELVSVCLSVCVDMFGYVGRC